MPSTQALKVTHACSSLLSHPGRLERCDEWTSIASRTDLGMYPSPEAYQLSTTPWPPVHLPTAEEVPVNG